MVTEEQKARRRESSLRWEAKNPGKVREKGARWRAKNPDYWRGRDKEKTKETQRRWLVAHPDYCPPSRSPEGRHRNYERHRGKGRVYQAIRRARLRDAGGCFDKFDVMAQLACQYGCCLYCGRYLGGDFEIDHLIAISTGGTSWPENIVLSCMPCNRSKGTLHPHVFTARLRDMINTYR